MANSSGAIQSRKVHSNLLENGFDSLLSAAEAVQRDEGPRSLKEAVLHIGNGAELLVKAKLAEEHWTLIFSNTDQASYEKLTAEEFPSVDFPKAVDRLRNIVGVEVDKSLFEHVESLRKLRNKLTHFTTTLDPTRTKSLVAKSMTFCVEFCEQQSMVTVEAEDKLGEIVRNLAELQEFVNDRMNTISEELECSHVLECPECWQEAMVSENGDLHCKFCRYRTVAREFAESKSQRPVEDCPECLQESTFAFELYDNDSGGWFCYSCGEGGENYDHCMRCNQMAYFPDPEDFEICDDCMTYIANLK